MALNDASVGPNRFFVDMAVGGPHDASSCSTATSEQSDKRKRPSPNYEEEAGFNKPYECRFCPMKFGKSQALGGHMNRHRQEREREQVAQARHLIMQQEFSSAVLMSGGQNRPSAFAKLSQGNLSRSTSEGSLKDGYIHMGAPLPFGAAASASAYRGVIPSNSYPCLGPGPSVNWHLGDASQNSEPAFTLDGGMASPYQNNQAYPPPVLNNNVSYVIPAQPLNRAHNQHDMMLSGPHAKAMQLSMYPLDLKNSAAHRSNSLLSQAEEASILAAGPADVTMNLLSSSSPNRNSVHQKRSNMKNAHCLSQAYSSLQSQQNNGGSDMANGFPFLTYPSSEAPRTASLDFNNLSSTGNQLDGLLWMHGNCKTAPRTWTNATLSNAYNGGYHHDLESVEPKVMEGGNVGAVSSGEQPKTMMRWDLALSSIESVVEDSKMRELPPATAGVEGVSSLPLEMTDDDNVDTSTGIVDGEELIND